MIRWWVSPDNQVYNLDRLQTHKQFFEKNKELFKGMDDWFEPFDYGWIRLSQDREGWTVISGKIDNNTLGRLQDILMLEEIYKLIKDRDKVFWESGEKTFSSIDSSMEEFLSAFSIEDLGRVSRLGLEPAIAKVIKLGIKLGKEMKYIVYEIEDKDGEIADEIQDSNLFYDFNPEFEYSQDFGKTWITVWTGEQSAIVSHWLNKNRYKYTFKVREK